MFYMTILWFLQTYIDIFLPDTSVRKIPIILDNKMLSLNLSRWASRIWTLRDIVQPMAAQVPTRVSTTSTWLSTTWLSKKPWTTKTKLLHSAFSTLLRSLGNSLASKDLLYLWSEEDTCFNYCFRYLWGKVLGALGGRLLVIYSFNTLNNKVQFDVYRRHQHLPIVHQRFLLDVVYRA